MNSLSQRIILELVISGLEMHGSIMTVGRSGTRAPAYRTKLTLEFSKLLLENLWMNFLNITRQLQRDIYRTYRELGVSQKCEDYNLKTCEGKWYMSFELMFSDSVGV